MSDDDPEDPFADLDTDDREGDPFERLTGDDEESTDDTVPEVTDVFEDTPPASNDDGADRFEQAWSDEEDGDNVFERAGTDEATDDGATQSHSEPQGAQPTGPAADDGPAPGSADDPFAGMDDREGDPFEGGESAFERVDVGSIDADSVWEEITAEDDDGPAGESVTEVPDVGYAEVSKHRYCEQCEFFSGPPAVNCSHDEAQILEFIDMETVRLADCPIVAEQRALENEE
ncbi:hypothetical protein [Haloarcula montana]|uniref:hypothetical protein n=1 Tax=Haloarcula montana TaxID=3111776 RepID=UPI002D781C61|nr:hypothetical protein [Haloarcula sp. GH36]